MCVGNGVIPYRIGGRLVWEREILDHPLLLRMSPPIEPALERVLDDMHTEIAAMIRLCALIISDKCSPQTLLENAIRDSQHSQEHQLLQGYSQHQVKTGTRL